MLLLYLRTAVRGELFVVNRPVHDPLPAAGAIGAPMWLARSILFARLKQRQTMPGLPIQVVHTSGTRMLLLCGTSYRRLAILGIDVGNGVC